MGITGTYMTLQASYIPTPGTLKHSSVADIPMAMLSLKVIVSVAVWLAGCCVLAAALEGNQNFQCLHNPDEVIAGVQQIGSPLRNISKRQTSALYEPLRIRFFYDKTIKLLRRKQRDSLRNVVIPAIGDYFESSLNVIRATSPILLDRACDRRLVFIPLTYVRKCATRCLKRTVCGLTRIPSKHLKRCDECNGVKANCGTRPATMNGPGVANTDLIVYVSANCAGIPRNVLLSAGACQLESQLDRPIAGFINFCPTSFAKSSNEENIQIGIHGVIHVLGFSPVLYPFFRDENGNPRTKRDIHGSPPSYPSNTTVKIITYDDWLTRNALTRPHTVTVLVTPNVIEQAEIHFNCSNGIIGVELENRSDVGTVGGHWEQRILGNEGMTSSFLFSHVISRITFGLLQDSGWYMPNYDMADELAWGKNTGCTIPSGSCREYIQQQQSRGRSISPYCDSLRDTTTGCTVDREHISYCNLVDFGLPLPAEYQFFNSSPNHGGTHRSADHCPFENDAFKVKCSDLTFKPKRNFAGQLYGVNSRCFELGRTWTRTNNASRPRTYVFNSGCYQYACTSSGVKIFLDSVPTLCACEGEEIVVNYTSNGLHYEGSYICPSCASVCYDNLSSCPVPEPPPCPGLISVFSESTSSLDRESIKSKATDLKIQFIGNTPHVMDDSVTVNFSSSLSVISAVCSISGQDPRHCASGFIVFPGVTSAMPNVIAITVTARGFTETLTRTVRSEANGQCSVHLINKGVDITSDGVLISVQIIGPSSANRINEINCQLDNEPTSASPCPDPLKFPLDPGSHVLKITPRDPNRVCTHSHMLIVPYTV